MGPPTDLFLPYQPSQPAACRSLITYLHDGTEQHDPLHEEICRLEARLVDLESEHKKIDAFKKELPLCMQLLHDAIEASKEQLAVCRSSSHKQPQSLLSCSYVDRGSSKGSNSSGFGPSMSEKSPDSFNKDSYEGEQEQKRVSMNGQGDTFQWMKVWNPGVDVSSHNQEFVEERTLSHFQEQAFSSSAKPLFHPKPKLGGAFTPFSRDSRLVQPTARPGAINPADFAIKCPNSAIMGSHASENGGKLSGPVPTRPLAGVQEQLKSSVGLQLAKTTAREKGQQLVKAGGLEGKIKAAGDASAASQPKRKARRSWSPELHRMFLDALQKLGGTQATPKQIRDVMKIEGLTNDEVKSHLQKYRLHAKRLGSSQPPSSHGCQVDLASEMWESSKQALQSTRASFDPSLQSQYCEMSMTYDVAAESHNQDRASYGKLICFQNQPLWVHSQRSRGGPSQLMGQPAEDCRVKSEVGGEESVGEAVKSENSGLTGNHLQQVALHESHQREDPSFGDSQSHCIGEDYRVGEDSEDYTS